MRGVILSVVGSIAATAAFGADLPTNATQTAAVSAYNWTGVYVGGQLGYGWGRADITNINGSVNFPAGTQSAHDYGGVIGGGQLGYNFQFNRIWVLGVEGDFAWSGIDGTTNNISAVNPAVLSSSGTKVKWLATATGRAGYAANNWLYYAKGGAAWARYEGNNITTNAGALTTLSSGSETRSGWTLGAGLEYAWGSWSTRFEYDYMDFGTKQISRNVTFATGVVPNPLLRNSDAHIQAIKFGINYRFN